MNDEKWFWSKHSDRGSVKPPGQGSFRPRLTAITVDSVVLCSDFRSLKRRVGLDLEENGRHRMHPKA